MNTFELLKALWPTRQSMSDPSRNIEKKIQTILSDDISRGEWQPAWGNINVNIVDAMRCFWMDIVTNILGLYGEEFALNLCHTVFGEDPYFSFFLEHLPPRRIMIIGETGTGKEIIAKIIGNTLIKMNGNNATCTSLSAASLSESLFESELFGHMKGSFSGAIKNHSGALERIRDGDALFIDEISECSPLIQAKLLRVIQTGEFIKVGGTETLHRDFHLIVASNRTRNDLECGNFFRSDLYYRLSSPIITTPPLRSLLSTDMQRKRVFAYIFGKFIDEDLRFSNQDMLRAWMMEHEKKIAKSINTILANYSWPGNLREYVSLIRDIVYRGLLNPEKICLEFLNNRKPSSATRVSNYEKPTTIANELKALEEQIYTAAFKQFNEISKTALHLGVTRQTASRKLKALGLI